MNLTITNLTKAYGSNTAVAALDHVNLVLQPAIYGLFGRNGAGKSTLLSLIANRLLPTFGSINLDGVNVRDNEQAQSHIYLVNETLPFLWPVRVSSIFRREERYYGGFDWGFSARMLAQFGIEPGRAYSQLSRGQRQIVRLVAALCVPTDVVLFDEPVSSLDAASRERFYQFVLESYASCPRTIIIATHIINEIAGVIERAIILDRGTVTDEFAAESVNSLATTLVGDAHTVSNFVTDACLTVLTYETLGRLANVTVRGGVDANELPDGIVTSELSLQEYVIAVTEGEASAARSALSESLPAVIETAAVATATTSTLFTAKGE
ncbi:ABC transporter [Bifidobacterium hapali]|uniref:ABC transporter n=1 Tax=Bifidobacterium hapali TaxID=1630172 RepID=A0A261FZZ3_9BIFI|nr:ABC transporter ATP-binding protein [Bifidobacterium hapali]OZG64483.1 ABC transporter [Bifidobacterium hapali]